MKPSRTTLFIAVSSLALLVVLIIQINWIMETARIKEELFNEKANMVLSKTADALSADQPTCGKIVKGNCGPKEIQKTDSLFNSYMDYYNFPIRYSFEVLTPGVSPAKNINAMAQDNVYKKRLNEMVSKNGVELKLLLPEKQEFIRNEMGPLFITSVLLILVVLVLFWGTVRSLTREKKISEHTTEFLNNMTHELKTPLTNISLAGKMIMKDPAMRQGEKIKHYSEIILEENEKLRLQVEQVLSMTALERGEIPLRRTELDFHGLIHASLKCISIQIENKKGELKLDLDASHFVVMGDSTHLTNAMCNLVDNAIKYAHEKPELRIQTYNTGARLVVVVADNGKGIEKEYQKKVFEKFFRVPTGDVHNVKGFGLGLAYIKKIIELHGGTITLKSEKNKGATFTFSLPYA